MGMLQNQPAPNLPLAPNEYDAVYMSQLANVLRLYFNQINAVQRLNLAGLNIYLNTLPTDADYVNLRFGDVYRDTEGGTLHDGTNVLRIKVPGIMTGVSASGSVGSVGGTITRNLTGVSGSGGVGPVGGTITRNLTGVSGSGAVGTVTP
jgi:hypothetical protein